MKDIDQKYSIKVGILGEDASTIHPDTNLTNAELGAIHEFGCIINVTEKMRHFFFKKWGIQKSNNPVVIPTRSFLRMPLLSGEFKEYIYSNAILPITSKSDLPRTADSTARQEAEEMNKLVAEMKLDEDASIMGKLAKWIGVKALERVYDAFESGGFGKWAPISPLTAISRKGASDNMPLTDTGDLRSSITAEVKRVK